MTDYLTRLTARTRGLMPVVQPLIPSRYAPSTQALAGGIEVAEESQVTERAMPVPDQPLRQAARVPVPASRIGVAEETPVLEQETQAPERSAKAAEESRLPERATPEPDRPWRYSPGAPVPDSGTEAAEESRLPERRIGMPAQESTLDVVIPLSPGVTLAASAIPHGPTSEIGNGIALHADAEVMKEQVSTAVRQGTVPAEVPASSLHRAIALCTFLNIYQLVAESGFTAPANQYPVRSMPYVDIARLPCLTTVPTR